MVGISRSTGHSNGGALRDDGIDRGQGRRTARLMRRFGVSNTVLLIICLMYLILYVDRVNISTAAPLIKADLDLTNTQLGLAFSAFAYPYALLQLIGGYIGDKFGPRLTLCVSSLIVCVATAATGVVGGLASLFAARLALGIGEGSTFPTATRAMTVWVPERSWGFAQGITHSFSRIGLAVTPPLIAVLIALVSWRGSFMILAVLSFIWVLVWMWYFRDVPAAPPLTAEELYQEALDVWADSSGDLLDKTLEFYTNFYLPDDILTKVDRASMMVSLESRAIFLDNDLVEFCRRLPGRFKLRNGKRKWLLKRAMRDWLPEKTLARRKKGFGIPLAKWLRTWTRPSDNEVSAAGGASFKSDAFDDHWGRHVRGETDERLLLFTWLSFIYHVQCQDQDLANEDGARDMPALAMQ